jgi:hypothetical protein
MSHESSELLLFINYPICGILLELQNGLRQKCSPLSSLQIPINPCKVYPCPAMPVTSGQCQKEYSYQGVWEDHHGAAGVPEQLTHFPDGERHNHEDKHEANKGKQGQCQGERLS